MQKQHQQTTADWLAAYDAAPDAPTPPKPAPKPAKPKLPPPVANVGIQQATDDWLADHDATPALIPDPIVVLSDAEIAQRERDAAKSDTPISVVNQKYLTADAIHDAHAVVIKSQHGTGKSTFVRELIAAIDERKSILYLVPSQALASGVTQQLSNSGFVDYRNEERLQDTNRVVCCIDSLERLGGKQFHTVIIDESEQVAAAILKSNAKFDAGNVAGQLELFCANAERVIYLDADAGPRTHQIAGRAGLTPHWIHNHHKPMTDVIVERVGFDDLLQQYEQDNSQKYLYCSERSMAEELHDNYPDTTLATGKTSNADLMHRITSGEHITDNIIATAALGTGVSIDKHDIKTIYAILKPGQNLPSALSAVQGLRRARNVKRIVVCCPDSPETDARPVDEQEIIQRELMRPGNISLAHMAPHWRTDLTGHSFDDRLIGLYAAHVADNNRQLNDFWLTIKQRLEQSGATVIESVTPEQKSTRRKFLKAQRQAKRERLAELCKTVAIPEHKSPDHDDVQNALFTCVDDLGMSEQDARETAAREIIKPGVIKGLKRRRLYQQGQQDLQRRDAQTIKSGNPVKKLIAVRAKLEIDLLNQSGIADDWITSGGCRSSCQSWLNNHLFDYRAVTANYSLTGKNTGALVVRVAESLGFEVERKTVKGTTHYRIARVENSNNIFYSTTHPAEATA